MSAFVDNIMGIVTTRNPGEVEFHQAVREVAESVAVVVEKHPELAKAKIMERLVEPEVDPVTGVSEEEDQAIVAFHPSPPKHIVW